MVEVREVSFDRFGKCACITNGSIELYVTLDFGPRIIRAGFVGGENMFFADTTGARNIPLPEDAPFAEKVYDIAGGHRLWTSPEAMPRSYYPDTAPVTYEKLSGNTVVFHIAPQTENGIQMGIAITMSDTEDTVTVNHSVTNIGAWPVSLAPWALSMMAPGGVEIFPVNDVDTDLLSNRFLQLWPYTKMTDPRVYWGDRYIHLKQDPNATTPFKVGAFQDYPWAAYFNFGDLFLINYDSDVNAQYPDHGCSFETYTCNAFQEVETLGAYRELQPGETTDHVERWSFHKGVAYPGTDEAAIDALMNTL